MRERETEEAHEEKIRGREGARADWTLSLPGSGKEKLPHLSQKPNRSTQNQTESEVKWDGETLFLGNTTRSQGGCGLLALAHWIRPGDPDPVGAMRFRKEY